MRALRNVARAVPSFRLFASRTAQNFGKHVNACSRIVSKIGSRSPALPYFPRNVKRHSAVGDHQTNIKERKSAILKNILIYLIAFTFTIGLIGCSKEPPSVRVYNQRSTKANVQIKTSSNTINQNDVAPGTATNYQNISEGQCEATASIQNESVSPTTTFNAANDNNYTIVIVNGNPPTLRVDSSSK